MFPFASAILFVQYLLLLTIPSITSADKKAPYSAVELCLLPKFFCCIIPRDVGQYRDSFWGEETKKYWRNDTIHHRTWLSLVSTWTPPTPLKRFLLCGLGWSLEQKSKTFCSISAIFCLLMSALAGRHLGRVTDNEEWQERWSLINGAKLTGRISLT